MIVFCEVREGKVFRCWELKEESYFEKRREKKREDSEKRNPKPKTLNPKP
jgi:hypothetical protein